jgi:hypothetical protein
MADDTSTDTVTTTEITTTEQTSTPKFVLARLKPFNPRAGVRVKTYTYKGHRFREEMGWYKISYELGEELKELAADDSDPYSPMLFDVLSEAEAQKLEEYEAKRRERASALRPNQSPDLRRTDTRRLATARDARTAEVAGVVTTSSLRAPNDEPIPNGYPPPRVYPMPGEGVASPTSAAAAVAFESGTEDSEDDLIESAKQAGVDDKTLSVNAANISRDMNGGAPRLIDGEDIDSDEPINTEGSTDFGADPDAVRDPNAPATPPSARRRRHRG